MELMTIPEVGAALGVNVTRVHQYLRDGQLVGVPGNGGGRAVPASFLCDGAIVKGLAPVITLLRDARYADEEIIDWLFRADDSLPGTPIEALRENRGTEVKRRAQAAGF